VNTTINAINWTALNDSLKLASAMARAPKAKITGDPNITLFLTTVPVALSLQEVVDNYALL